MNSEFLRQGGSPVCTRLFAATLSVLVFLISACGDVAPSATPSGDSVNQDARGAEPRSIETRAAQPQPVSDNSPIDMQHKVVTERQNEQLARDTSDDTPHRDDEVTKADLVDNSQPQSASVDAAATASVVLDVVVESDRGRVLLHAGPNVDWKVLQALDPGQVLRITSRVPNRDNTTRGYYYHMLLAVLPDGTAGWVSSEMLDLDDALILDLDPLSRNALHYYTHGILKEHSTIYPSPEEDSPICELQRRRDVSIEGRTPDNNWFAIESWNLGEDCNPSLSIGGVEPFWVSADDVTTEIPIESYPVALSRGLWMIHIAQDLPSERLPVNVLEQSGSESWSVDPDDGSLVFVERYGRSDRRGEERLRLIRYSLVTGDTTLLGDTVSNEILIAPRGGDVITLGRRDYLHGTPLLTVDRSGKRTEIGRLYRAYQNDRERLLSDHVFWLTGGQAIGVADFVRWVPGEPTWQWTYDRRTTVRIDFTDSGRFSPVNRWRQRQFHPDTQSMYFVEQSGYGRPTMIRRVGPDGEGWPGFAAFPGSGLSISPDGNHMVALNGEFGIVLTDQGEPLRWIEGESFEWLSGGDRIRYRQGAEWVIEGLEGEELSRFSFAGSNRQLPMHWSPQSRFVGFTLFTYSRWPRWQQYRLIDVEQGLLGAYRYPGCSGSQWLPDESAVLVSIHDCVVGP